MAILRTPKVFGAVCAGALIFSIIATGASSAHGWFWSVWLCGFIAGAGCMAIDAIWQE